MGIGNAISAKLFSDSAVAAIIGDRIFPAIAPQDGRVYPQLVYAVENASGKDTYAGDDNLISRTVRVACLALTYDAADSLSEAVFNAIDDQSGTWGGTQVQGCFYEDQTEDTQADDDAGQGSVVFIIEHQYTVWYATQ